MIHAPVTGPTQAEALLRGGQELSRLANALRTAECRINTLLDPSADQLSSDDLAALQDLDRIIQSIDALSAFIAALSQNAGGISDVALAIEDLPLVDLRLRLRGHETGQDTAPNGRSPELF